MRLEYERLTSGLLILRHEARVRGCTNNPHRVRSTYVVSHAGATLRGQEFALLSSR